VRILGAVGEPIPLFEAQQVDPARFAAAQRRVFEGHNLHIGRSDTVHALIWADWINGLALPSPACHQGWSGLGAAGELRATRSPITCAKCRKLVGPDPLDPAALTLFPLP
jgi:hypothetical protein